MDGRRPAAVVHVARAAPRRACHSGPVSDDVTPGPPPDLLWTGPAGGPVLVLAHGSGAPMDSPWMTDVVDLLARRGVRTARFEFTYMAARRAGRRPSPPRAERLVPEYLAAAREVRLQSGASVVVGGKSLGGRVASLVVDELVAAGDARGLVCLGYPFHPPGQPEKLRTGHLAELRAPALVCQGERDPFGSRPEVRGYALSPTIDVRWMPDGDHGFRPRVASGRTAEENLAAAADAAAAFVHGLAASRAAAG